MMRTSFAMAKRIHGRRLWRVSWKTDRKTRCRNPISLLDSSAETPLPAINLYIIYVVCNRNVALPEDHGIEKFRREGENLSPNLVITGPHILCEMGDAAPQDS